MKTKRGLTIIMLGRPGSGKGTQAELLARSLRAKVLGTGHLLRELSREKTFLGRRLAQILDEGDLAPSWLASFVWIRELGRTRPSENIIFDGSPRTLREAKLLDAVLAWYDRPAQAAFLINIAQGEAFRRLRTRKACVACRKPTLWDTTRGSVAKKCRACGGRIVKRADDAPVAIRRRLALFRSRVLPIVAYYRARKILRIIDGMRSPELVARDIVNSIKRM